MDSEGKLVSVVAVIETAVIITAYMIALGFRKLTGHPPPRIWEVLAEQGLLFLLLPLLTGILGFTLVILRKERLVIPALVLLLSIAIAILLVSIGVVDMGSGGGMRV